MCGIAGFVDSTRSASGRDLEARVRAMTATLAHRGPDGEGAWVDPVAGLALGHRRLAILDLSDAGRQPMQSACGRYAGQSTADNCTRRPSGSTTKKLSLAVPCTRSMPAARAAPRSRSVFQFSTPTQK